MNITNIEVELRKIQALVGRWSEQGYVPAIEKNIALQRVQKFYELFLDLDTQAQIEYREPIITPDPAAKNAQESSQEPFKEPCELPEDQQSDVVEYVELEKRVQHTAPEQPVRGRFTIFGVEITDEQKLRFTHDLFCNDPLVFHNEIAKIEKLRSLDEVLIYIGEKYAWVPENPSADEFVELIAQSF